MADKCQVLCQHPGCWYSGEKRFEIKGRECPGYIQYMDCVVARRKARNLEPYVTTCDAEDGLPFLTVTEIPTNLLPTYHQPLSLQPPHDRCGSGKDRFDQLKSPSLKFSIESPLYADRGRSPSPPPPDYDEYWFTPMLVWQPGKKKTSNKHEQERKKDRILKTTNLTDSLPDIPHSEPNKDKRPTSRPGGRRCKGFRFSMDEYIMEGLSDVPSHIVNQIIQEIHSCSDNDLVQDCPPTGRSKQDDTPRTLHSSPYPSPITPSFKLRPLHSTVPSSVMLNIQSKKIQTTYPKERRNSLRKESKRRRSATSYSRTLASHPQKALSGLKTRVTQLQEEADQYYMFSKPSKTVMSNALNQGSRLAGSVPPQPPLPVKSGPSYFSPRSLNKATVQRLMPVRTKGLVPLGAGKLDLSVSSTAKSRLREFMMNSLPIPPRPSVHIPLLPIHDRPFSEELSSTIPPDSRPEPYARPDSRHSTLHSGSHMSSDRMIISADLASQTGELLLLNREGEVVHHVTGTTDTSVPINSKQEEGIPLPIDSKQDECEFLPAVSNQEKRGPLEVGSVAPPPTAREDGES